METAQEVSSQDQDGLAGEVMESLGMEGSEKPHESEESESSDEGSHSNATLSVQKRLKSQRRAHEREVRELQARIGQLESRMTQPNVSHDQSINPYMPPQSGVDEHIHKAVSYALQQKEMEERKAHESKMMAHVQRKYQDFNHHLDNMSDKYDDFHDVVMAPDATFTPAMRDYAARTMSKVGPGSAGEVLYKLGKNPSELNRIANLHPDDQAEEMHKLSLALIKGDAPTSSAPKQLGNIKNNPVGNSHAITDKTPIGTLRERMKSGHWK